MDLHVHLSKLKVNFQTVLQAKSESTCRSCWKRKQSDGEEIESRHLQLSVYSRENDLEIDGGQVINVNGKQ